MDWDREAGEIVCRVRAYEPWPGSRTLLRGEEVRIVAARPVMSFAGPDRGNGRDRPGAFLGCREIEGLGRAAVVRCGGTSVLALDRVQRPGRRPVSGIDLANGLRLTVGERFGVQA